MSGAAHHAELLTATAASRTRSSGFVLAALHGPRAPERARSGCCRTRHVNDKVNLAEKFACLERPYQPGIVGYMNDYKLQIVKVKGPFVWHKHEDTDDFFLVVEGRLTIQLRDRNIQLEPGELFVVPRGVEHCPTADEETLVLLIEPRGTANTGDAGGELTAEPIEL